MANTMNAGVCVVPHEFKIEQRPLPDTAPEGWALVDIACVGICGTDYHIYEGLHPFLAYPRVIGHELSGHLLSPVGDMEAGTLVSINPYVSCGNCRACQRKKPNCCVEISVLGVHQDGGMCQRIAVPEDNLYPATGLTPIQAAMVEFLAIGAHAVARSRLSKGERVLVVGAGPIGLGAALFAQLAGGDIHLLDISEDRLSLAKKKFGFTQVHDSIESALAGQLSDGYDVVFDATGNRNSIESGFQFLAHGSSYVLVSVVKGAISFDDAEFHKRETQIIGSRNALRGDFRNVMAAIRDGLIDTDALCSEIVSLEELPKRFPELVADRGQLVKAIVQIA